MDSKWKTRRTVPAIQWRRGSNPGLWGGGGQAHGRTMVGQWQVGGLPDGTLDRLCLLCLLCTLARRARCAICCASPCPFGPISILNADSSRECNVPVGRVLERRLRPGKAR